MLLAARDIIGGINWVQEYEEDGDIAKITEKKKKAFAGTELEGKKIGVIGLGAIGVLVAILHPSWNGGIWLRSICFRRFRMETFQKYSSRKNGG